MRAISRDQVRVARMKADDYVTRDGRVVGDLTVIDDQDAPYIRAMTSPIIETSSGDDLDMKARRSDLLGDLTVMCNEARDGRGALSRIEIASVLRELSMWFTPRD